MDGLQCTLEERELESSKRRAQPLPNLQNLSIQSSLLQKRATSPSSIFLLGSFKKNPIFAVGRNLWQLLPPHSLHKILISVKTKARVSCNHFGCYNPGLENATISIFTFTITIFRSAMISWNTFLCCVSCNHFGHILHFLVLNCLK